MARLLSTKGQPVRISFFDLFFASTPSRSSFMEREKPKKEQTSSIKSPPNSITANEAPTEPTKVTEPPSAEWTEIEEMGLLGAKALNKTWKEISAALPGKNIEDIKKKYRELYIDAPVNIKPKVVDEKKEETNEAEDKKAEEKGEGNEEKNEEGKTTEKSEDVPKDEANATEETNKDSEGSKKGVKAWKKGKKGQKRQKGEKGKEVVEEPKPEGAKAEEANVKEANVEGAKLEEKGFLKAKATVEEKGKGGGLKSIYGHPVIFVDDDEELEFEELFYLYSLSARYDEQKWITVDSKFFDKFGKRVGAEKVKEKLAGSW